MAGILDYVSSIALGGMVFLSLMAFYGQVDETHMSQVLSANIQEECSSATEILESDLRKVGFGVVDTVKFGLATTAAVRFAADIDANGTVDSVSYYLSLFPASGSSNPDTRILYRRVNGVETPLLTNVTSLSLNYYDRSGNTTLFPSQIRSFDVRMTLKADAPVDGQYAGVVWSRTFKPHNLR